jgi:hypothetical protein
MAGADKKKWTTPELSKYIPPEAIRLCDYAGNAMGGCNYGGSFIGYRRNSYWGACVTGKWALEGCHAGIGVAPECQSGSAISW